MIIITNGTEAVIAYSESQWLDAAGSAFPATYQGFRISGHPSIGSILGVPAGVAPVGALGDVPPVGAFSDMKGDQSREDTPALSQAEVEALAVDLVELA